MGSGTDSGGAMTPEEAQAELDRIGSRSVALGEPADGSASEPASPEATAGFLWNSRLTALAHLAAGDEIEAAQVAVTAAEGIREELQRGARAGAQFASSVLELLADDPWWAEEQPASQRPS